MKNKLILIGFIFILFLNFCKNNYEKIEDKIIPTGNSKKIASFSDLGKVNALSINGKHLFINDDKSVYAFHLKSFKFITKLNKAGEGPEEFKYTPEIKFSGDNIYLMGFGKIAILNNSFKYIKEIKFVGLYGNIVPLGKNFIINDFFYDRKKYDAYYFMINRKTEKIKPIISIPKDPYNELFFLNVSRAVSWNNKLFIAQPHKGFYIDVFDIKGNFLYKIDKKLKKIKSKEKHRELSAGKILFLTDKRRYENYKKFGKYKDPMQPYVPDINNFWVIEDKIYVKTYDIKEKTEKYIIMDLKGNIIKAVFLPITYITPAFHDNKFYYLKDNGKNESWDLYTIQL